jgi:hypothetical protein
MVNEPFTLVNLFGEAMEKQAAESHQLFDSTLRIKELW